MRTLDADEDVVLAAMLQPLLEEKLLDREAAGKRFGEEAVRLARALSQLGHFGLPPDWTPERGLEAAQAEALRKMLVAVIGDVRLVVVRLAAQLQKMRSSKSADATLQRKLAIETREVYAPLANRLGVWQVKWELEDLAFRYLQPAEYKHIAAALKVRRAERERYIEELKDLLQGELRAAGIEARIDGRPKHIYSIWRKMQAKQLAFDQLMDIRAARVLVNTVAECYAALGIVHSLWQFIPGEFDDYIATPKDNLYRSIHTAVIGPGNEPVEIQIRTHEMHANSERGVAAHWRYKEGGRSNQAYERKINQLRALLSPERRARTARTTSSTGCASISSKTASTCCRPKAKSSTCPSAARRSTSRIRCIPIWAIEPAARRSTAASSGSTISSRTAKRSKSLPPRRRNPRAIGCLRKSGFLASPRHRNKVRAWFRKQNESQNKLEGRAMLDREMQRLGGVNSPPMPELLASSSWRAPRSCTRPWDSARSAPRRSPARFSACCTHATARPAEFTRARDAAQREPEIEVQGIGDLLSTYARCCKPVPPEPIVGYITVGRGVSIHSQSCANLARLSAKVAGAGTAGRLGNAAGARAEFPVDIEVQAFDRRGLVRDVSAALADEKISIRSMNTVTDGRDNVAHMQIGILITGLPQLSRVLARIAQLPNMLSARRKK